MRCLGTVVAFTFVFLFLKNAQLEFDARLLAGSFCTAKNEARKIREKSDGFRRLLLTQERHQSEESLWRRLPFPMFELSNAMTMTTAMTMTAWWTLSNSDFPDHGTQNCGRD
jgi:hypothetical protein